MTTFQHCAFLCKGSPNLNDFFLQYMAFGAMQRSELSPKISTLKSQGKI